MASRSTLATTIAALTQAWKGMNGLVSGGEAVHRKSVANAAGARDLFRASFGIYVRAVPQEEQNLASGVTSALHLEQLRPCGAPQ